MEREGYFRMEDEGEGEYLRTGMFGSPSKSGTISSPPHVSVGVGVDGGTNYIVHPVTKFDTLAGVAIKYGVEVTDIKKLNGLVTDLQMFALKTLQIPLPGRHPPSPNMPNGHETPTQHQSASSRKYSDFFDSFQSLKLKASSEEKISPALSTLRGYYGLKPVEDQKSHSEGFEMALYQNGEANYLENNPFSKSSPPVSNPPLSHHRKSKSVANCLAEQNGDLIDRLMPQEPENNDSGEKVIRRRQKSVVDFTKYSPETKHTPETLLKNENNTISSITGKGLALRPKASNRVVDSETGGPNPVPVGSGDSSLTESGNGVRRSCSTSNLQESENGTLSSLWPSSKWSLKPDFQALSTATITRPIFDGLPKPSSKKNKAALD